ncbi:MAG: hypothetical protein ACRD3E_03065, partial [Terriglobales bacterium]
MFEPNRGQAAQDVRFVGKSAGLRVSLKGNAITIGPAEDSRSHTITMTLAGARANPVISAFGELPGKSNYLLSSDRRSWIIGLPTYTGVRYHAVYPNTDLVFRGDDSRLEYDFSIAPGGDPAAIAWRLAPDAAVHLDGGDLVIASSGVQLRFLKPVAYQENDGVRREVSSEYRLRRDAQGTRVEFAVGRYDRRQTLVIDQVLVYSTQVSGMTIAEAATVDAAGNVYLASGYNGGVQVTKLAADGKTVVFTTMLGTNSTDVRNIAVDGSGQVYVTGESVSGLPTTAGAYLGSVTSGWHAFLTVVDASGTSLVYSTYLAGSSTDVGQGVALDASGKVLVSGVTYSPDFPNTNNVTLNGSATAFVAKLDIGQSGGASLVWSALLPSSSYDSQPVGAKTDSAGNVYVALQGIFTPTIGAYQYDAINRSADGVYVGKLNAAGATQYIAYLGYGAAADLAVDGAGNAYVTGTVYDGDYPATAGAYQTSFPNAFLTKLNAGGSSLVYSTYLGGASG